MKKLLIVAGIMLAACGNARAQTSSAIVVGTCGTPPVTYSPGSPFPMTQSTGGNLCTGGGGGGGGTATVVPATSGGVLTFDNAVGATATAIKASAGQLYGYHIFNSNSTVCYVQLFNLAAGSVVLGYVMASFTDAHIPWLDSALTSFSLVAQFWMARKYVANWWLWIAVDIIYVGVYIYKDLDLTAGLYAAFIVLAVIGLRNWQRQLPGNHPPAAAAAL